MLFFDAAFDSAPHLRVMKEVFTHVFVTPRGHRKSKPFLDHVICFYWLDGRVWFRNYQAVWPEGKSKDPPELVEARPQPRRRRRLRSPLAPSPALPPAPFRLPF